MVRLQQREWLVRSGTLALDESYLPNKWIPFMGAFTFHILLFAWNPTILSGGNYRPSSELLNVTIRESMPVMEAPKPEVKPVEKPPVVKKSKKSGLSISKKAEPVTISKKPRVTPAPVKAAPKPFVSKITMPKFVPRSSDEMLAASPAPGVAAAAPHRAVQAIHQAPVLKGKTRGIRASDINFELTDRGALNAGGGHVVAIPIGAESGDVAVLPQAQVFHEAPKGKSTVMGYRFKPGDGTGSGELAGKDRGGRIGGYHGAVQADSYIEGSLSAASGNGSGKVVTGQGFEIGGPVGDRKILARRLPEYPEWAEEKGISAMVKVYFTVKADGTIRQAMRIVRSSGYPELDQLAKNALLKWRFSPTSSSSSEQEAWGVITFRFTLG